ncbi:universal stress protein [Marinobacter sp. NP-4(2019)]|uniref:universal stress protein n=1 Tax=Marinobacter sp. NP-4(2019) TaxID=2488665 RepID=UPI001D17DBAF|nr:universal stress protein [Marinobacter sp. NP-4(2019)]
MADAPEKQVGSDTPAGRVLVLLDGSRMSYAALNAAADIAACTGADVLGVFVEEQNLLRSAGYGFAREVGAASGISRPLDVTILERRMQRLAMEVKEALARAVSSRGRSHELSVARGRVVDEVLTLVSPQDLLVLGRVGWSSVPGSRLGSTARGLIRKSPSRVLLWSEGAVSDKNRIVVLLNDHADANRRAIQAATEASRYHHLPVTVLLRSEGDVSAVQLETIRQDLDFSGAGTRLRVLPATDPATVARVLREECAAQLVVSRECSLFSNPEADQLLIALNLPITITP